LTSALPKAARDAERVGLLKQVDLEGIHDPSILDEVLKAAAQPLPVS